MAQEQPLVSVLIATYNRPEFLRRSIASVLKNTYENFEVVVSDDASPQDNRGIADSFADSRIRYRRNETRLGMAGNHTLGVTALTGKYVALLNDDDEWEPQFLERLVPVMEAHPDVVLAFSDHHIMNVDGVVDAYATDENTRRWKRDTLAPGVHRPFFRNALVDLSVPVIASLLRRDAIDWSDCWLEVGSVHDLWVLYKAGATGLGVYYVPERLMRYRVHRSNESAVGGDRMLKGLVHVYSQFIEDKKLAELRPDFERILARAQVSYGLFLIENGKTREARDYLWNPLQTSERARAAIALALTGMPAWLATGTLRTLRNARRRLAL